MNDKAVELGLVNTHFETPHGLDSDEHYTTTYELALLSNYALNNKIFAQIVGTKEYTITINNYPKQLSNTTLKFAITLEYSGILSVFILMSVIVTLLPPFLKIYQK